eukprot:7300904-Alexandrium_andersonii.AAC.1
MGLIVPSARLWDWSESMTMSAVKLRSAPLNPVPWKHQAFDPQLPKTSLAEGGFSSGEGGR